MKIDIGAILQIGNSLHQIYHAITGKRCVLDPFKPTTDKPVLEVRDKATPGDENLGETKD